VGTDDYYSVPLPSASSLENVVVTLSPMINGTAVRLRYALEGANGIGPQFEQTLRVIRAGNGDFQASVAWTGASDLDLHVFDPSGEEVYFGRPVVNSGGTLDIDSNAACSIDNTNVENIFWPLNVAPAGEYRVQLAYYDDCNVPRSDWVVTVLVKGHTPFVTTGNFAGAVEAGATPPLLIGNFTY
jgi:hypothetical protein